MIIERPSLRFPLKGLLLALAFWFVGMAALACIVDPAFVIVFGADRAPARAVAASRALLVSAGPGFVTARSDEPGYVRRLYANGAWFVWPALRAGCGG
jgi:hypothetical protein